MKKITVSLLLAAAFYAATMFLQAHAEDLTAKISNITGEAAIIRAGQDEEIPAKTGMDLNRGDIVKTGAGSFVTVTFLPKTYIELAAESRLRVTKHGLDPQTSKLTSRIDILSGHISKAILIDLPKDAVFDVFLSDYLPLTVEGYSQPGQLPTGADAYFMEQAKKERLDVEALPAVLSNISGIVEIIRVGSVKAIQAADGMELNVGDTLKTGKKSFATISFSPKTFVKVADNSEVKVVRNRVEPANNNARNTRLDVLSGHLSEADIGGLPPASNFEIVLVDYIPLHAEGYIPTETGPILAPVNFTSASDS